jgi:hypothetical protein
VSRSPDELAQRYVAWVKRRALAIILAHVVLVAGAVYLIANHLPLRADFSYLLPQDTQSVRDLRKLEARVRAGDSALVVALAMTPEDRAGIVDALAAGIRKISPELVESVETDDSELRAFLRERRHLFVPLAERRRATRRPLREGREAETNPLIEPTNRIPRPQTSRNSSSGAAHRSGARPRHSSIAPAT